MICKNTLILNEDLIPIALLYRKEYRSVDNRDISINIENKIRDIAIFKGIYRK